MRKVRALERMERHEKLLPIGDNERKDILWPVPVTARPVRSAPSLKGKVAA